MKLKYLDARNCHGLLPSIKGLPVLKQLDKCLEGINKDSKGAIDELIKQNKNTDIYIPGSKRIRYSPIRIAQHSDVIAKSVHTQAIVYNMPGPAELHSIRFFGNRLGYKTIVPLQFLLKGWGDANSGYQCYIHTISQKMDKRTRFNDLQNLKDADKDNYYYVGITGRNWILRLKEHIGEVRRGSRKKFHQIWRESTGMSDVLYTSYLRDVNRTYEDAMDWEEEFVDKIAYDSQGLNMIPGGFKGLKFLHEHRVTDRVNILLQERDKAIAEFVRRNPLKGKPNPFIAELWQDDEYYVKIMDARPKTLSRDQVSMIRELHGLGRSIKEIAKEVGAIDNDQVKRVIGGKTYKRYR